MELRCYRRLRLPAKPFVSLAYYGSDMDFGFMTIMSQTQLDLFLEKYKDKRDDYQIYNERPVDEFLIENLPEIEPLIACYALAANGVTKGKIWADFKDKYSLPLSSPQVSAGIQSMYCDLGVGIVISLKFFIPFGNSHPCNITVNNQYLLSASLVFGWLANKKNYYRIIRNGELKYLPLSLTGRYKKYMPVPTPAGISDLFASMGQVDRILGRSGPNTYTKLLCRIEMMCNLINKTEAIKKNESHPCFPYYSKLEKLYKQIGNDVNLALRADYAKLGFLQKSVPGPMDAVSFYQTTRLDGDYVKRKEA